MLKRLATSAVVVVATTATVSVTAPANAAGITAVNACAATANGVHSSSTCMFTGLPGEYFVDITTTARYAWSKVTCSHGGEVFVDVWDTEGGYDYAFGGLQGATCTLVVASGGASTGTTATGTVRWTRI